MHGLLARCLYQCRNRPSGAPATIYQTEPRPRRDWPCGTQGTDSRPDESGRPVRGTRHKDPVPPSECHGGRLPLAYKPPTLSADVVAVGCGRGGPCVRPSVAYNVRDRGRPRVRAADEVAPMLVCWFRGGIAKRTKATDCKSVIVGSNPTAASILLRSGLRAGASQD